MGILDDAIREHLELKREHGVAEDELSRQEREALGPARRGAASPASETAVNEPSQDPPDRSEAEPETEEPAPVPAEREPVASDESSVEELEPSAEAAAGQAKPAPTDDTPPRGMPPVAVENAAPSPPAPSEGAEDEDVLEETPEFLQETPEHDRLWFEQKPPRDFDFDEK